jgi:hypothetical protein
LHSPGPGSSSFSTVTVGTPSLVSLGVRLHSVKGVVVRCVYIRQVPAIRVFVMVWSVDRNGLWSQPFHRNKAG